MNCDIFQSRQMFCILKKRVQNNI